MCTCVCMCTFLCIQVCVYMHAHIHIGAKNRAMSTSKFCCSGKETRIPPVIEHVSTTKERRNFFRGHITCLREQSNSYHTLSSSLLPTPPLNFLKGPFFLYVSGNCTGPNIIFCIQETKVKQTKVIFLKGIEGIGF